jgi:hypothetical protein
MERCRLLGFQLLVPSGAGAFITTFPASHASLSLRRP